MKSVFVGNMNSQTTEGDLRALFEPFGEVARVHVVSDHGTGLPRGFAFVEMADDIEARIAIADLNGRELAGRRLTLNEPPRLQRSRARRRSDSVPGAR